MKHKFVIVGGGTAGMIAATSIKSYYGIHVDVTVIYDHKNPGIGVGESLTPLIYDYFNYVGITRDELVKHCNATVKLGLKFKNWLNDGKYYYHNFRELTHQYPLNLEAGYDIVHNKYNHDFTYGSEYMENCLIPSNPNAIQSIHFDAVVFSRYIEKKFSNRLNIIDGIVDDVILSDNDIIKSIILKDGRNIEGDFFIDASGFQYVLFKKLKNTWVDKKDWLPLDRCIPNPVEYEFTKQPPYTTSEASDQGWILQVPLSNRWGAGYLYSSQFLDDTQAFTNFEKKCQSLYGKSLTNTSRVIKFNSGYWQNQWVGNCLAVGLSSGFSEPLEATNIHHCVYQLWYFIWQYNFKCFEHDRRIYNETMTKFYENVYLYLRFCYVTGRTDSEFWKYMTYNIPKNVKDLQDKVSCDILNERTLPGDIFNYGNFTKVAYGLRMIENESYKNNLLIRNVFEKAKNDSEIMYGMKSENLSNAIDHRKYINRIQRFYLDVD
jgi:tryptophan halogenase